jgi:hypothetical protein
MDETQLLGAIPLSSFLGLISEYYFLPVTFNSMAHHNYRTPICTKTRRIKKTNGDDG